MESSLLMTFFSNNWAVKMRVKNVKNTSSNPCIFFPSKQTLSCLEKTCIKFLEFAQTRTQIVLLLRWKDQLHFLYYKCNTSKYSVLDTIQQHFSVFLFLQNCISSRKDIQQQQNVPSKGLFLQHFKISKWLPFSLYVERYTTESWSLIRKILLFRQYKKLPLLSNIDFLLEE